MNDLTSKKFQILEIEEKSFPEYFPRDLFSSSLNCNRHSHGISINHAKTALLKNEPIVPVPKTQIGRNGSSQLILRQEKNALEIQISSILKEVIPNRQTVKEYENSIWKRLSNDEIKDKDLSLHLITIEKENELDQLKQYYQFCKDLLSKSSLSELRNEVDFGYWECHFLEQKCNYIHQELDEIQTKLNEIKKSESFKKLSKQKKLIANLHEELKQKHSLYNQMRYEYQEIQSSKSDKSTIGVSDSFSMDKSNYSSSQINPQDDSLSILLEKSKTKKAKAMERYIILKNEQIAEIQSASLNLSQD